MPPPPFRIEALMPTDTPACMLPMWLGALHFAVSNEDAWDAFIADTGHAWRPGRTPVDRLIDDATGATRASLAAFIAWFNVAIWGPWDGPAETGDQHAS